MEICCDDEKEVVELALKKITAITNAMSAQQKIVVTPVLIVYCVKKTNFTRMCSESIEGSVTLRITVPKTFMDCAVDVYEVSKNDKNVADVLSLYNHNNYKTFINLYKIGEIVEADKDGKDLISDLKLRKKYKNFTHTANNPKGIGPVDARHGHEKTEPSPSPMKIDEAEHMIQMIVSMWISKKIDSNKATLN